MNTVNVENFNDTLDGYVGDAVDFLIEKLREKDFDEEEIQAIIKTLNIGIYRAKECMTMKEARNYKRKK